MNSFFVCSLTLDGCSVIILLLILLPQFIQDPGRGVNRRRSSLLNDAVVVHLFGILIRIAVSVSSLIGSFRVAEETYGTISSVLGIVSAVLVILCLCCDESGRIRLPKGREIPILQIVWTVLPVSLAACLAPILPGIRLMGIAWAISLHILHSIIMIDSEKQLAETEERLERAHAAQMATQMQPHFLFNTLSAIEALCQTDPLSAAECMENLSGYLRGNIDALNSEDLIPFDTEFRHIRQYIALELADPSRQFQFVYELDVRDFKIPSLTVQPIVENAAKHGALTHRDGGGRVVLTTEAFGSYIRITITDNGNGRGNLTKTQKENHGIGIESTRKRLQALCGGSLQITTGEGGTKAVILISKKER